MRLLNARDLTFKDFIGYKIPDYAIVSHRWGDDELSYQDFLKDKEEYRVGHLQGQGWTKIVKACELAHLCQLKWIWLDTICINKESSAELTEAINSMFIWYENADTCFVFLPDVHDTQTSAGALPSEVLFHATNDDSAANYRKRPFPPLLFRLFVPRPFYTTEFERSMWFERSWNPTEVPSKVLIRQGVRFYGTAASIAERMRWASHRKAARTEDEAYSLLGLFDINMPLLYGEGKRAFRRLQLEIIRCSSDESILASQHPFFGHTQVLADTAFDFSHIHIDNCNWITRKHFDVTNMGLRFDVPICSISGTFKLSKGIGNSRHSLLFPLNCTGSYKDKEGQDIRGPLALLVDTKCFESNQDLKYLHASRVGELLIFKPGLIMNRHSRTKSETSIEDLINNPDYGGGYRRNVQAQNILAWYSADLRNVPRSDFPCHGKWTTVKTSKTPEFDLMVDADPDEGKQMDEYSLYIAL